MSLFVSANYGRYLSTWLTGFSVALIAFLPGCAQAFPFIAAGGGAVILPYLLAMLAGLMRSKIAIAATTLSILGGYWLVYAPYDYVTDTYSFEENRLAGMLGERVHSIRNVRMTAPDLTKEVAYPELFSTQSKVLFVNDGGLAWRNGFEAEFVLSNQRFLTKDTILVSAGAELSETIANATQTRWLKGGLIGVLESYAQRADFPALSTQECQPNSKCARIGVMGPGFFMRFSGFPYNSKDRMIDLHELMMPNGGGIEVLKGYQDQGLHLSLELYDYPGKDLDRGMFNFLQSQGIKDLSVHYYDEQAKTKGNIDTLASRFGGSNKHLDLADIDFLCKNDTSFVMAFDGQMNTGMLFPETLRENCEAIFLPVEGMLPHQIAAYIKEHPLPKGRRFVGIYTDKSTAFYTKLMLGLMADQGYPVVGITSLDKEHIYVGDPLKRVADSLLLSFSQHIKGADGKPSSAWVSSIFSLIFVMITGAFLYAERRWLVMLAWVANLGVMLLLNFFARYIPNDLTVDIFEVCVLVSTAQLVLAVLLSPRNKPFSKASGLTWLNRAGFDVPRSRQLHKFNQRVFNRLMGASTTALIFRSCASGENLESGDSGRFSSVVAKNPYDFDRVAVAWQEMIESGRKPGFVVQPYLDFETAGAVSSVRDFHGHIGYVIETSKRAEGVTSGHDPEVIQQFLSREALTASLCPLHQGVLALHRRLQGHFLAEFGVEHGKVVWLQVMRQQTLVGDHRGFHQVGYCESALNGLIDVSTDAALGFMSKAVVGIDYLHHQGNIFERPTRIGTWITAMSFAAPWRVLAWLIGKAHEQMISNPARIFSSWHLLFLARLALIVDQIALSKGLSDSGVQDTMTLQYATTFGASELFLQSPAQMCSLLSAYQICERRPASCKRINLQLSIRDKAREVVQVAYAIECSRQMSKGNHSSSVIMHEPSFSSDPNLVCAGSRPVGGDVFDWDAEDFEKERLLTPSGGATVLLARADLSLLVAHQHIACVRLKVRPAYNSHFVQRCLAYGIRVEVSG
ncbi:MULTISPECIES: hypothetical protein [Pseudomonas]|uniref:hypothetical protein n=1 Tax=Pseudomonas TaxID=286 RepID=UPI000F0432C4|nr:MULTISPECIES: hypothetical protein [Pseudomonas]MBD8681249.1 hypothetical protein [Pseudomonas sp. CFBP 13719]